MHEQTHRHAAIMFTDIVGYTALMGSDEDKAFEVLKKNQDIHKKLILQFNGTLIKEMGDGMLISFDLASEAVRCAIEIQKASKEQDIPLKIGIHEGEMVFAEADVLGDSVNIASRLQENAEKGCIHISSSVYKNVRNKADINTKFVEKRTFKNVAEPVKVYKVLCDEEEKEGATTKDVSRKSNSKYQYYLFLIAAVVAASILIWKYLLSDQPVASMDREKSIAVMPFDDFSPEGDQEWLSNGLMEAINLNLVNIEGLRIIGRTTMMQYKDGDEDIENIVNELHVTHLLQGSVLKYEDNIRVNVQLIAAKDYSQQWAASFDQKMDSIFNILDEVAINVGNELEFQFNPDVLGINPAEKTDNIEAYELYLKARYIANKNWGKSPPIVKDQIEQAIFLDSTFVAPYTLLGWYWLSQMVWDADRNIDTKRCVQKAREYLEIAISKDPEYGDSYIYMGYIKLFYDQELTEARRLLQKGLELNRTAINMQILANTILPAISEFKYALELIQEAMIESPLDPGVWSGKALNEYFIGDYASARKTLEQGVPRLREGNLYCTAARVYFGMKEYSKVREVLEKYLIDNPGLRPARVLGYMAAANYHLGNTVQFNELLTELKQQAEVSPLGSPSFHISFIYAQMGEIDTSFEWLDKAYEDHEVEVYWLKVEPPFEPLHDDPRWQEMLDKVGFPE